MKGGIYTKEHCPICGRLYRHLANGIICIEHQTRPRKVFISIYSKQTKKAEEIYSNSRGEAFGSYQEAERLLSIIRGEIDAHGDFDVTKYISAKVKPLKFVNWVREWLSRKELETEKGLKSPSYLKTVRVYVVKYAAFFKETDIREIGTKSVNDFYLSLHGSPHYIKNILDCLRKMMHDALDWGDIYQVLKFPKIYVPEPTILTIDIDQQDAIINSITDQMERAFILFTARVMLRPCEPRALYWTDLDFKHHRVIIQRHFSLNKIRPATKSRNNKIRPFDNEVEQALLALPRHITSPFVFWKGKDGRPFSESWARKVWKKYAMQLGISTGLYCGTKHSSATEAADRVGVDAVQEYLGHTSRKTTLKYVQNNPDRLRKVLRDGK